MNILIIGGGGFIGTALANKLSADKAHNIKIFCRTTLENHLFCESIEVINGDFCNSNDVERALIGIDVVIHLVSATTPAKSSLDPIMEFRLNLIPTSNFLELAKKYTIKKIIFASSGGTVYGEASEPMVSEASPTNPLSYYGIVKLAIEKLLIKLQAEHNIKVIILRISNPYGINQDEKKGQGALTLFMKKGLKGEGLEVWGDGQIIRDYIYIDDVVDSFIRAISYDGTHSIFNIATGKGTTLNELIRKIGNYYTRDIPVSYKNSRAFDIKRNVLDISLAKSEMGWSPQINLDDGIHLLGMGIIPPK
jgi:UDP-glucose 4-epimerase